MRIKDLEQGIIKLIFNTLNNVTHPDYERVTILADEYKRLITGHDIKKMLSQFIKRETAEEFDNRAKLTEPLTPAITEKIQSPFQKVGRMDNIVNQKLWEQDPKGEKKADLNRALDAFNGDRDLNKYMQTRFTELTFSDPNAFIVVEFENFDPTKEKAKPFPIEYSAKEVLDFYYHNNTLNWLIVDKPLKKTVLNQKENKLVTKVIPSRRMYLDNYVIQLDIIEKKGAMKRNIVIPKNEDGSIPSIFTLDIADNKAYVISIYQPKAGQVQAVRVGYREDKVTENRTTVSPLHPALPRIRKTLKTGSEFDITMTLHAFPQKYQYVNQCEGEKDYGCNKGKTHRGEECKACDGTGLQVHKSAQDAIFVPIPRELEEVIDLAKMSHYNSPPIDLVKFQEDFLNRLEDMAIKDVFSSEAFQRSTGTKTATEKELDMENVYDTLFPFGEHYSLVYCKLVTLVATFRDLSKGFTCIHAFPKDFKLKTINVLLSDLKTAKDAGTDTFVKTEIQNDIAEKIWVDNPLMLRIFKVKQQHLPFAGKTQDDIQFIITSGICTEADKVLWSNFESIFKEIELEEQLAGRNFYDMTYQKRKDLIDKKVEKYKATISEEQNSAAGFSNLFGNEGGE